MIKRVYLIVVLIVCMLVLISGAAFAGAVASGGDKIGVIDSQNVITNHPKFEEAMKELQVISRKKEEEARAAADLETDENRKAQKIREKRMELAKEEQRIMEPIIQQAQTAVRSVAKNKGLTIILEKASVYVGGIDITQDVIQEIKKIHITSDNPKRR